MLYYQVASNSPGGATSSSEMSKLAYYRHVYWPSQASRVQKSFNYNLLQFFYISGKSRVAQFFGPLCTSSYESTRSNAGLWTTLETFSS